VLLVFSSLPHGVIYYSYRTVLYYSSYRKVLLLLFSAGVLLLPRCLKNNILFMFYVFYVSRMF